MSVINLAEYKDYYGITNPNDDRRLGDLTNFVNSFIEKYCDIKFEATTETGIYLTASTDTAILVNKTPLISVDELRYKGTAVDSADYIVHKELGLIESVPNYTFSMDRYAYTIDVTHGYSSTPSDIKLVAIEYMQYLYKREFNKSRNLGNGESADYGDVQQIPSHLKATLNMYKRTL